MNDIFKTSQPVCDLLHQFVPVSSGLSDEQIKPSLTSTFDLFIVPVLGQSLADEIIKIQDDSSSADKSKVVEMCRKAVANLAFWFNFTELNVRITDQGFQRQEGDTFKSLYKYQEDDLKDRFKNKGFNALDALLSYLDAHQDLFPDYKKSPAYTEKTSSLVRSAEEVDKIYFINRSQLVFLRLKPIIRNNLMTRLPSVIGKSLHDKVMDSLSGNPPKDFDFESLRVKILPFVVLSAISDLIESTGNLTDRGLYYSSVLASSGNTVETRPLDLEQRNILLNQIHQTTVAYRQQLVTFLHDEFPDDFSGNPSDIYQRDNTHKRTFFA